MWKRAGMLILIQALLATEAIRETALQRQWCVADEQATEEVLQAALDWACGPGGANCSMIQERRPCFLPNTLKDHASYAFNSYWQQFKNKGGSCYFAGAAIVTESNPSYGSCRFDLLP